MTTIEVRSVFVFKVLFFVASLLVLSFVGLGMIIDGFDASTRGGVWALFNMNAEISIPTWYSQSLLLLASGLLLVIGLASVEFKKHWLTLSALLLFVSMDEGAAVHELTTGPIRQLFGIESGLLYYSWMILFVMLLAVVSLFYIKFLYALSPFFRRWFIVSAAVFLIGAVGFEMIGAAIAAESGEAGNAYMLSVAGEEFLEMLGVIVFIYALLEYLKSRTEQTAIVI